MHSSNNEGSEIGVVMAVLKIGATARRQAWPRDEWLVLVPGSTITVQRDRPLGLALPELVGEQIAYSPHLDVVQPDGVVASWSPTHEDLLATDWVWRPCIEPGPDPQAPDPWER
ncbi:MW1434 family type I TA system toxin [Lentzea sp. NBRC 102530]|uniref:Thoeris anti-defense Tad2 family protein n=1 Tax=Lentzea sp. NBRC 102530 TaxID=3032201 RepID=UPI0024A2D48B|nr:MW1434 family type I TA system toxin [Lentzea sp. NBRC 102530]GLY55204.1 hypothetical protein Lesp01_88590 [Lentzea sp. NBRC 102530]